MALNKQGRPQTANSAQELQNDSFDPEFRVAVVEMLGVDNSTTPATLNRLAVLPDGNLGNNSAITLGYTGDNLTTITKTIGAVSYVKTLTYSGSVLTDVSGWVQS